MGTLTERLEAQLKTEYKKQAEECIIVKDFLKTLNNGSVWNSEWSVLTFTIYEGQYPNVKNYYQLTEIGKVCLAGISLKQKNELNK